MNAEWAPDGPAARLAVDLLARYHEAAQSLKVLRHAPGSPYKDRNPIFEEAHPDVVEKHRAIATGLFGHLFILLQARLISPAMFCLVCPRPGAVLWLALVAPLDFEVRKASAARRGVDAVPLGQHEMEIFYQRYADTGDLMLRMRPVDDQAKSN